MRMLQTSDMWLRLDKSNNKEYSKRMNLILSGSKDIVILQGQLEVQLQRIKKFYRSASVVKMIDAVKNGDLVLFYSTTPRLDLPVCLPFFKYQKGEYPKVAVNLTPHLKYNEFKDTDEIEYEIDLKKLYSIVLPAYYYLALFNPKCVLSNKAIDLSARLWSKMFVKILIKVLGISSNKEKLDTFTYFSMMFFMIYYLDTPKKIAEDIAEKNLRTGKNVLISEIESKLEERNINIYDGFEVFCNTIFRNEYTKVRSIGGKNSLHGGNLDYSFFIKNYINTFDFSSYLSLASYPYFIFSLFAASTMSHLNSAYGFEDIVRGDNPADFQNVLVELNKMC